MRLATTFSILLLIAPLGAKAVVLAPGDLLVSDLAMPQIVHVDRNTLQKTRVAAGGWLASVSGNAPWAIALEPGGTILAVTTAGDLVRIDPSIPYDNNVPEANQSLVHSFGPGVLTPDAAVEADGNIAVAIPLRLCPPTCAAAVARIGPGGGVPDFFSQGQAENIQTIAVEASGSLVVGAQVPKLSGTGVDWAVVRVDPITGLQSVVSQGGQILNPGGLAVEAGGSILITERTGQSLVRVTGAAQQVVTQPGDLVDPIHVAVEANGDIVVADQTRGLVRIDAVTNAATLFLPTWDFVTNDPVALLSVWGVAVVPVPEPSAVALQVAALVCLAGLAVSTRSMSRLAS